jgi:hypothetical protein
MRYRSLLYLSVFFFSASCKHDAEKVTDLFPVKAGKLFQFVDRKANVVISPQFDEVSRFAGGLALVNQSPESPKWGYIDQTGNYIISPSYVEATTFNEDCAFVVSENNPPAAIDRSGAVKFTVQDAERTQNFYEGLAACSLLGEDGERWGFIDKTGKIKIEPNYANVGFFSEDMCSVANEHSKWGFINKSGVIIIDYQFDNVSAFEGGTAKVLANGKWGVITKDGKYLIQPKYEDIYIDRDQFLVKQAGKWGWVDKTGKAVIDIQFASALPFNKSEYAPANSGGKWGYINRKGEFAITPQYDFAFCFDGRCSRSCSG